MATAPLNIPGPVVPVSQFKDRKGWLIAFGVFEVLLGALGILFTLFIYTIDIPQPPGQPILDPSAIKVVIALVYGLPSAYLILMGIGSMRAHNWARIGMLVFSWFWLGTGVLSVLMVGLVVPTAMDQAQKSQHSTFTPDTRMVMTVTLLVTSLFLIALPAVFLRFYHSKNVKATCLASSPLDTTNGYPVPVAILLVIALLGVFSYPVIFFLYPYLLIFGHLFEGTSAKLIAGIFSVLYLALAWNIYRLKPIGWWGMMITTVFFTLSAVVTFLIFDMNTLYEKMGQAELMRQSPFGQHMNVFSFLMLTLAMGMYYVLLILSRKYFFPQQSQDIQSSAQ